MAYLRVFYLAAITLFSGATFSEINPFTPSVVTKLAQASFKEYLEFLSMPSDASVPADIQKNADFIERAFQKRGFTTKQLANNGKPMLYAEFTERAPRAKTILFYMHMDSQPVVPTEWSQKNPWAPVVKQRNSA